jgi:hypothetical protein
MPVIPEDPSFSVTKIYCLLTWFIDYPVSLLLMCLSLYIVISSVYHELFLVYFSYVFSCHFHLQTARHGIRVVHPAMAARPRIA